MLEADREATKLIEMENILATESALEHEMIAPEQLRDLLPDTLLER